MLERGIRELLESTESLKSLQAKLASKTKWAASLGFTGQGDEQFFDTLSQAVENRFQAERQLLEQLEQLKAQLYQDAKD